MPKNIYQYQLQKRCNHLLLNLIPSILKPLYIYHPQQWSSHRRQHNQHNKRRNRKRRKWVCQTWSHGCCVWFWLAWWWQTKSKLVKPESELYLTHANWLVIRHQGAVVFRTSMLLLSKLTNTIAAALVFIAVVEAETDNVSTIKTICQCVCDDNVMISVY